jgi:hypothetical protein
MYQNSLKRLRFYDYGISRVIYIVFIERKRGTRQEFGRWLGGWVAELQIWRNQNERNK